MGTKKNRVLSPYFTNKQTRSKIDKLLHKNAILQSNLGIDSTKEDKEKAHGETKEIYNKIKALDTEFAENSFPEYK